MRACLGPWSAVGPEQGAFRVGDLNLPACWHCGLTLQCHFWLGVKYYVAYPNWDRVARLERGL